MRWRSSDGVWEVSVLPADGGLRFEITSYGGLRRSGTVTVQGAHAELNVILAELGAPPLEDMEVV